MPQLRHLWGRFGGLRWQLSLAMVGAVAFTAISIAFLVIYIYEVEISAWKQGFSPATKAEIERILDSETGTDLDTRPELLLSVLLPFLGAVWLALTIAGRIARPLEAVSKTARKVARGDLQARVPLNNQQASSGSESMVLARNFNRMADELEKLEQERRVTTAAIAHELRTPLTILRGRLQAGADGMVRMDEAEAQVLLQQTEILTRLVDDLKTLSLAEAGRLSLQPSKTDLTALVRQTVAAFEQRASERKLELTASVPPNRITLDVDAERIKQVLGNLIENAIRHTPSNGTIDVVLQALPSGVLLEVRDAGPGIPEDVLPLIFERFYRVEDSRARVFGGSGLGLAIVRAIVELHQGSITAHNHPNGGAVFQVTLPRT